MVPNNNKRCNKRCLSMIRPALIIHLSINVLSTEYKILHYSALISQDFFNFSSYRMFFLCCAPMHTKLTRACKIKKRNMLKNNGHLYNCT